MNSLCSLIIVSIVMVAAIVFIYGYFDDERVSLIGAPKATAKWILGKEGKSCNWVCQNNGKCIDYASPVGGNIYWPCYTDQVLAMRKHNLDCAWIADAPNSPAVLAPYWDINFRGCLFHRDFSGMANVGKCASANPNVQRLCYCIPKTLIDPPAYSC